jgi:hypothetical protein
MPGDAEPFTGTVSVAPAIAVRSFICRLGTSPQLENNGFGTGRTMPNQPIERNERPWLPQLRLLLYCWEKGGRRKEAEMT